MEEEEEEERSQRMKNSRLASLRGTSCPDNGTAHMMRKLVTTSVKAASLNTLTISIMISPGARHWFTTEIRLENDAPRRTPSANSASDSADCGGIVRCTFSIEPTLSKSSGLLVLLGSNFSFASAVAAVAATWKRDRSAEDFLVPVVPVPVEPVVDFMTSAKLIICFC